jgi:hypothetical protein
MNNCVNSKEHLLEPVIDFVPSNGSMPMWCRSCGETMFLIVEPKERVND